MTIRPIRSALLLAGALAAGATAVAQEGPADRVRVATFNASLSRPEAGGLIAALEAPDDLQARAVAEIIQRADPDILLLNEFDYDAEGRALALFRDNYLAVGQDGAPAVEFPYAFLAPVNTGVPSGLDLDRDGASDGPGDALGFGRFPGQYGMVLLSRFPILEEESRTFRSYLWRDLPGALLPDDPATPAPADWYSPEALGLLPLSSKSHWDVAVAVGARALHLLASHPTPPVFDGPEDRNGARNADEVRFWMDYVLSGAGEAIVDDAGRRGGLPADADFVILGDLNLDPADGDGRRMIGARLLGHQRVQDPRPASAGGPAAAAAQAGRNVTHRGDPALDTADFADDEDGAPGNLRVDYVLPSRDLEVIGAGVFWPPPDDPLARLLGTPEAPTSDHRLVWVDLRLD